MEDKKVSRKPLQKYKGIFRDSTKSQRDTGISDLEEFFEKTTSEHKEIFREAPRNLMKDSRIISKCIIKGFECSSSNLEKSSQIAFKKHSEKFLGIFPTISSVFLRKFKVYEKFSKKFFKRLQKSSKKLLS